MHRSSISGFRSLLAYLRPGSWFLVLLALLIIAELLLRIPAVLARLPEPDPTLWHAEFIQSKLDYLKTFQDQQDINVLFIGNSVVQAGVNPEIFDTLIAQNSNKRTRSFNGAIEGLPPYGVQLFLEIYLRYVNPDVIIYGITPQDLNSNSPWAQDVTERVKAAPLAIAESRRGLRGKLTGFMLEHSNLYRYRFVIHQLLLRGGYIPEEPHIYFDERGYQTLKDRLSDVPPINRGVYMARAGVSNYSTSGVQLDSLIGIIEFCAENDIELILVNFPLADGYYFNFDTLNDYDLYMHTIQPIANRYHIPFWDMENVPTPENLNDSHFSDFNHLNKDGAAKLTKLISNKYLDWIGSKIQSHSNTSSH